MGVVAASGRCVASQVRELETRDFAHQREVFGKDLALREQQLSMAQQQLADQHTALLDQQEALRQYDVSVQAKTAALRAEWEQIKRTRESEQVRLSRWQSTLEGQQQQFQNKLEEFERERERELQALRDQTATGEQARKDKYRETTLQLKKRQDELDARETAVQEMEFQRALREKEYEDAARDKAERLTLELKRQVEAYQSKQALLMDERSHFEREQKSWQADFDDRKRRVDVLEAKLVDREAQYADTKRILENERRTLDELKKELDAREAELRVQTKTSSDETRVARQRLQGMPGCV
jgi:chromosome segregation ATPase